MLTDIKAWLDKAAAAKPEAELMAARLAPDMHPLPRQVQIASDTAKGALARLTGTEPPSMPDDETTIAELKERCDKTIAYLAGFDAAALADAASRPVELKFPNGMAFPMTGQTFLTNFALPNFYFHATTTYALLRAAGVPLGKFDYLAHMAKFAARS